MYFQNQTHTPERVETHRTSHSGHRKTITNYTDYTENTEYVAVGVATTATNLAGPLIAAISESNKTKQQ